MSIGFLSEYQLGLQSVLAAEAVDEECLPFDSVAQNDEGLFYKFVSQQFACGEFANADEASEEGSACRPSPPTGGPSDEPGSSASSLADPLSSKLKQEDLPGGQQQGKGTSQATGNSRRGGDPPHRAMVVRFQRLKAIRHPHLCAYTNVLRVKRRLYLVSEHWSLSLQDILDAWAAERDGPFSPSASAVGGEGEADGEAAAASRSSCAWEAGRLEFLGAVVGQTLTALAHLNSLGIAHNRLEPRTIRIDAYGNVRLSEWGLSYLTDGGRLAPSADLLPAFAFLAPEQVLAGPDVLMHAAACSKHDVWALGLILLKALQPDWLAKALVGPRQHPADRGRVEGSGAASSFSESAGRAGRGSSEVASEGGPAGGEEDAAFSSFGEVGDGRLARDVEALTQLVFYCALGVDCQVLLPLEPSEDKAEAPCSDAWGPASSAPTLSAVGSQLAVWQTRRLCVLEQMMAAAAGKPCHLLPRPLSRLAASASEEKYQQQAASALDAARDLTGSDGSNRQQQQTAAPPRAARRVEAAAEEKSQLADSADGEEEATFFRDALHRFSRWLSGAPLRQRQQVLAARIAAEKRQSSSNPSCLEEEADEQAAADEAVKGTGESTSEADAKLQRLLQEVLELLRCCLTVHPSSRPAPGDLLAAAFVQKAQRANQLWCLRGAESLGLLADLHVEEELRRVCNGLQEGEADEQPGSAACGRARPWLPYSCEGSSNSLSVLLRSHNIELDEVFYWWQLQGGDVHASLQSRGAFLPIPPIFLLPLGCLLHPRQPEQRKEASSSLRRLDFLAAFADSGHHDASSRDPRCSRCLELQATGRLCSASGPPPQDAAAFGGRGLEGRAVGQQQSEDRGRAAGGDLRASSVGKEDSEEGRAGLSAAAAAFAAAEREDSFFSTGFTGHRNWRDVRLWKEGDVRVFGVGVEETLKAIQEADRFPVTRMSEVRPPCVYRRQCHFLYQRVRVRLFKSLLAQLPKSRQRLMEEAALDVPPLLRPEIWAALMGVNQVGVLHTTRAAYEEAAFSLGSVDLEALQGSEFSQYHEYHDLLGSEEGRRRLVTLVGVTLQRNPTYVCVRGMDALAAPLLLLYNDQENVALACLEKLLQDFQQHLFAADSAAFLRRQLAASNRLLLFVDPQLAFHMHRLGLHSDMYALSWHLTLFSHVLPLQQLLLLWDTLLLQPPTFVHFLTVCILHFLRVPLLGFPADEESTAVRLLQASFEFLNVPALCAAATALQAAVPWSLALLPAPQLPAAAAGEAPLAASSAQAEKPAEAQAASSPGHAEARPSQEGSDSTAAACSASTPTGDEEAAAQLSGPGPQAGSPGAQQFFIGEGEESPRLQVASPQITTKNVPAAQQTSMQADHRPPSSAEGPAKAGANRKSSNWKTRALMSVIKGPALMLLGAPRKPNMTRALPVVETDGDGESHVDPMEALYSSEPLAVRWWNNMDEKAFLQTTSAAWQAGEEDATAHLKGEGLDLEQALQPPCVGVDVLLQFHKEGVVLDVRPRPNFESLHFIRALHVTPKDLPELICLLRDGQVTLPDPQGVLLQAQRLGSSKPRADLVVRPTAAAAAAAEATHTAPDAPASSGVVQSEHPEATQLRRSQASPAAALQPWISAKMKRLPLIVVVGDREDTGAGLARRLLKAGISCVCVLLGGIEALQLDAPFDFLAGKYVK